MIIKKVEASILQSSINPQQYFAYLKCCTYYHILWRCQNVTFLCVSLKYLSTSSLLLHIGWHIQKISYMLWMFLNILLSKYRTKYYGIYFVHKGLQPKAILITFSIMNFTIFCFNFQETSGTSFLVYITLLHHYHADWESKKVEVCNSRAAKSTLLIITGSVIISIILLYEERNFAKKDYVISYYILLFNIF